MPPLFDKELEVWLKAAGKALSQPSSSLDKLLCLLDRIEKLLSRVEQSPSNSLITVISPIMDALITEDFLKHSDDDVKVGVASCISEIIRITAPDAPYDDDKMKEVFHLIVWAFEDLSDTASRSYFKRVTILETIAKVRYCLIMLDLEMDQLIIEMFQHFLRTVNVHHSEIVSESMVTVMTLVLEESEDMTSALLTPIMAAMKTNEEDAMQNAKKLAEQVIQNCAELRPYLNQALQTSNQELAKEGSIEFFGDQQRAERAKTLEFAKRDSMEWVSKMENYPESGAVVLLEHCNGKKVVKSCGRFAAASQGERADEFVASMWKPLMVGLHGTAFRVGQLQGGLWMIDKVWAMFLFRPTKENGKIKEAQGPIKISGFLKQKRIMNAGSLEFLSFRRASYFPPLCWKFRLKVTLGAANWLEYLHSPEDKTLYRESSTINILLLMNYKCGLGSTWFLFSQPNSLCMKCAILFNNGHLFQNEGIPLIRCQLRKEEGEADGWWRLYWGVTHRSKARSRDRGRQTRTLREIGERKEHDPSFEEAEREQPIHKLKVIGKEKSRVAKAAECKPKFQKELLNTVEGKPQPNILKLSGMLVGVPMLVLKENPNDMGVRYIALAREERCKLGEVLLGIGSHKGAAKTGIGDVGFSLGAGKLLVKVLPPLWVVIDEDMPNYSLVNDGIWQIISEIPVVGATFKVLKFVSYISDGLNMRGRMLLGNMVVGAGSILGKQNSSCLLKMPRISGSQAEESLKNMEQSNGSGIYSSETDTSAGNKKSWAFFWELVSLKLEALQEQEYKLDQVCDQASVEISLGNVLLGTNRFPNSSLEDKADFREGSNVRDLCILGQK